MTVAIGSGPADVLDAGMVTTFTGHDLTLLLVLPEGRWTVELAFSSDPAVDDVSVQATPVPDGLRLECVNFDGPDGRGSSLPVLLGELGDDLVFFHFRAFRYGRTPDHTVHYTFYRASKADVGWTPGG
ncbi:MAG: hypothetical protein ACI8PZ_000978 [Myxococcota bacterium]|jgi:hypothetical protein